MCTYARVIEAAQRGYGHSASDMVKYGKLLTEEVATCVKRGQGGWGKQHPHAACFPGNLHVYDRQAGARRRRRRHNERAPYQYRLNPKP